jgi:hypothetical protein
LNATWTDGLSECLIVLHYMCSLAFPSAPPLNILHSAILGKASQCLCITFSLQTACRKHFPPRFVLPFKIRSLLTRNLFFTATATSFRVVTSWLVVEGRYLKSTNCTYRRPSIHLNLIEEALQVSCRFLLSFPQSLR